MIKEFTISFRNILPSQGAGAQKILQYNISAVWEELNSGLNVHSAIDTGWTNVPDVIVTPSEYWHFYDKLNK